MKIITKQLKENYNVSNESSWKMFFKWIWIFVWLTIALFVFFLALAHVLINFISIEDEKKILWWFSNLWFEINEEKTKQLNKYVWESFEYNLIVIKLDEENAYTLPWWTIAVTEKLLENIKYENSLLFIIWHEIWHIKNRDVFKKIVSEFPIKIILFTLWIWSDLDLSFLLSWTSSIYSKSVESKADIIWVDYLFEQKWNVDCLMYFFEKDKSFGKNISTFLSDHPMNSSRIQNVWEYIKQKWYNQNQNCNLLDLKK